MEIANNPLSSVGFKRLELRRLDRDALDYGAGFRVKVCFREIVSAASLKG
jgi:hypothetical protein